MTTWPEVFYTSWTPQSFFFDNCFNNEGRVTLLQMTAWSVSETSRLLLSLITGFPPPPPPSRALFFLSTTMDTPKRELSAHCIFSCPLHRPINAISAINETSPSTGFSGQTCNYAKHGSLCTSPPPSRVNNPVKPAEGSYPTSCNPRLEAWNPTNAPQHVRIHTTYSTGYIILINNWEW